VHVEFYVRAVPRLVRMRADVYHAHDANTLLPAALAARLTGAKLVYDSHEFVGGVPHRSGAWGRTLLFIERRCVRRASAVVTVSDGIATALQTKYGLRDRPLVLRNVADPGALSAAGDAPINLRRRLAIPDGVQIVLHQGAIAVGRGCVTLARAAAYLPADVVVVFLGDGTPAGVQQVRSAVAELGLERRVLFHPKVRPDALLAVTGQADLGVSLLERTCENHWLALPNKLFEYVQAGLPVAVSDFPELGEVVRRHGLGITVDPHDPVRLAARLTEFLRDDAALSAARDAVARARGSLSWEVEQEVLRSVYRRLDVVASSR
jgi:glycosyltransferase involved in cell wall biosynthesis